ncbi:MULTISPECIES: ABC transporter ATP-binding protein [Petrotoga]|uniref:Iron complex transport system ATP-binding protein n=2 Tax=Petrotoga sibirica TaxID=156202 RepID=A0A4R8EZA0_9BACT|nr:MULTISPECIES: ABC transporter ATP-binding protein [Petrotoga]KUK82854.1 MAG: ABC transporter related [Petrotoga mobilis]POZ89499.1 ABC transporter [Petrotoga sibirica DSM 13575]POZ91841.1 ABC transporter [Petrotoga sp. SL27]TDX16188.1 iron complex transport system ATP-binding protein [Petrotoga sibirica]
MITFKNVRFTYGNGFFLKIEDLKIKKGDIISIIGPNGAGKSTLIKILSGILRNYKGEIILQNNELKNYSYKELSKKVAVVPQEFNTSFDYDLESIVSTSRIPFSKRINFFESEQDRRIIDEALKTVGLISYKNKPFSSLSGGEKQKVMIARAIAQQTPVLLLDEFSSHLDPGYTQSLLKLVKEMVTKEKKTVLAVFHDVNNAALFSDKIIVMKDGSIRYSGTPAEVLNESIMDEIFEMNAYIIKHPVKKVPQILFK